MYRVWIGPIDIDNARPGEVDAGFGESPVLTLADDTKSRRARGAVVPWAWTRRPAGRGRIQAFVDRLWLDSSANVSGLVGHALRDAGRSDFLLGDTPETWSPAGSADFASLGRWLSLAGLDTMAAGLEPDAAEPRGALQVSALSLSSKSPCLLVQGADATPQAVVAVASDSFLVVVPPGSRSIRVRVEEQILSGDEGEYPDCPPWDELNGGIADPDARELLIWRWYEGENSRILDGLSRAVNGAHDLVADHALVAGVLVGRVVRVMARRSEMDRSDPLLGVRRRAAWRGLSEAAREYITTSAPRLRTSTRVDGGLVVVVHGTHATGVHLASAIRGLWGEGELPPAPVVRFEHDTWQRLETNALDLYESVSGTGASHVLFVAHSRGGLVAARALAKLEHAPPSAGGIRTSLVTLGTPFHGTPVAHAPDALWATAHTLMGAVRIAGGPVVDATTRVLGWTIKRSPPDGLAVMATNSQALPPLREALPAEADLVGGHARDASRDYTGIWGAFRTGVGSGAFRADEDNDLVVATASALAGRPNLLVSSDHSSYLLVPEVRDLVKQAIERLPAGTLETDPDATATEQLVW